MAGPSTREERDSIRALRLSLLPEAWRWMGDSDWGVLLRFQNHWLGRVVWRARTEGEGEGARAWVVGAFHTGRGQMAPFFEREALAEVGLEVEYLWERDCDGRDREWAWDRGVEDVRVLKRWLAIGVLKRIGRPVEVGEGEVRS